MIETYKLLSGKYDSQVALKLSLYLSDDHHMRGNSRRVSVKCGIAECGMRKVKCGTDRAECI